MRSTVSDIFSSPLPAELLSPAAMSTAPPHLLNGELWIEVAETAFDLDKHADAWDDLGCHAAEPNVYYERWMFEPALKALARSEQFRFVFVYRKGKRQDVAPALVGFFPLIVRTSPLGLVTTYELWGHDYCFLRTPLIREGHLVDTLNAFFAWTESKGFPASILELPQIHGEGPFAKALTQVFYERKRLVHWVASYNRALLVRSSSGDEYIHTAVSSHQRQEVRRQSRRLAELGTVEFRKLDNEILLDSWLTDFFRLEDSGWKGEAGTSLNASEESRAFFREVCERAWKQGQLEILGLFLNGAAVAMKVNFLSGNGSYAFKIAYREDLARYSPGVQLELENIQALHNDPKRQWMDSCAVPNHFMINRLWKDQRTIQHLLASTGRRRGNLLVGLLPLLRAIKRTIRPIPTAP